MCGRYSFSVKADSRWARERFDAALAGSPPEPRWNIAPTDPVLAVGLGEDGTRRVETMRWDMRGGRPPSINVRSESALARPPIRKLLSGARSRVLIPADGFYEWLHAEAPGQPKMPVRFHVPDEPVFAFAGVRSGAGVAMFTTAPNDLVRPVHDRMPVILDDRGQEHAWLDPSLDAEAAHLLLDPLPAGRMAAARASSRVNDVRADGPELWDPDDPAGAALQLF